VRNALVVFPADVEDPRDSLLVRALRVGVPSILDPGSGNVRMPYDAPMPEADIRLIEKWIAEGAVGAQCVPNAQDRGCSYTFDAQNTIHYHVIDCEGGNIGAVVEDCNDQQICAVAINNGVCAPRGGGQ
jgi:hypothetical protein